MVGVWLTTIILAGRATGVEIVDDH